MMQIPPQAAKIVVGKIAEQVAIQAAAELLLRRMLGKREEEKPKPRENPLADLEIAGFANLLSNVAQAPVQKRKKRMSRFNVLVKEELKKMKNSRKNPKEKLKLAAKRASRKLKQERRQKNAKKRS